MLGSRSIPGKQARFPSVRYFHHKILTNIPHNTCNHNLCLSTHARLMVTIASDLIPSCASAIEGWQIAIARNHRGATQRKFHLITTGKVEHTSPCALVTAAHVGFAHDLP